MASSSGNIVIYSKHAHEETIRTIKLEGTMRLTLEDFLDLMNRSAKVVAFSTESQFDFPEVGRSFKARLTLQSNEWTITSFDLPPEGSA